LTRFSKVAAAVRSLVAPPIRGDGDGPNGNGVPLLGDPKLAAADPRGGPYHPYAKPKSVRYGLSRAGGITYDFAQVISLSHKEPAAAGLRGTRPCAR
jgi:hypothetical protein